MENGNKEGPFLNFVSPFLIRECTEGAAFIQSPVEIDLKWKHEAWKWILWNKSYNF